MSTYHNQHLRYLHHLRDALGNADLPSELQGAAQTLHERIAKRVEAVEASFAETDEWIKMPGMGVIEVIHETLTASKYYFGSDIGSAHQTRVRLYQARMMKADGRVLKDELVSEALTPEGGSATRG